MHPKTSDISCEPEKREHSVIFFYVTEVLYKSEQEKAYAVDMSSTQTSLDSFFYTNTNNKEQKSETYKRSRRSLQLRERTLCVRIRQLLKHSLRAFGCCELFESGTCDVKHFTKIVSFETPDNGKRGSNKISSCKKKPRCVYFSISWASLA